MTTGYRINSAKDDAAGYAVATKMAIDLSSYNVVQNNTLLGTSLLNTATSSLDLVTTHLQRIRDLAEQAANGTYGPDSIVAIQEEINERIVEIDRVLLSTEYNGIKLFSSAESTPGIPTIDESKRVINQTTFQAGETYYLTQSSDLVKLQDLVNSGVDTTNVTFELMADINMRGVAFRCIGYDLGNAFRGTFNGNQHVISNLTINSTENNVGLFGSVNDCQINSLGLENVDITGADAVGGLVGDGFNIRISNSYVTGSVIGVLDVGGLIGTAWDSGDVGYSYSSASVKSSGSVGGLIGSIPSFGMKVHNSYAEGQVTGNGAVGGFIGFIDSRTNNIDGYFDIDKTGQTVGVGGGFYSGTATGLSTADIQVLINNGTLPKYDYGSDGDVDNAGLELTLQIGIDSSVNSQLKFGTDLEFKLDIDVFTIENARNALNEIDIVLGIIMAKQTEFGAVQNRLDSVLDSLNVSIQNTTSSLSTIRDADIAKVSADYIRAQILQQASASLLATANQAPSIALNLI